MTTQTLPIVSLQDSKDVSINAIEAELSNIWQSYNNDDGIIATRANTFTFIIYEPGQTQYLLAVICFYTGTIDGIVGPRTIAAIKSAEETYKLKVTGESSEEFILKLQSEFKQAKAKGQQDQLPHVTASWLGKPEEG